MKKTDYGRLIDADALIEKYGDWYAEEGGEEGYIGTIKGLVDRMPTIEPERKKGKWMRIYCRPNVLKYLGWTCSECGGRTGEEYAPYWYKFCPVCGADMREGGQE